MMPEFGNLNETSTKNRKGERILAVAAVDKYATDATDFALMLEALGFAPATVKVCSAGHQMTRANTRVRRDGRSGNLCRTCENERRREQRARAAMRGEAKTKGLATTCGKGHEYTPENTYHYPNGRRRCVTCHAERNREAKQRYDKKRLAEKCTNGHEWTPETTVIKKDGRRQCTVCINERYRETK